MMNNLEIKYEGRRKYVVIDGREVDVVFILNTAQMIKYVKNGLKPLDIFYSEISQKVIYVYGKEESHEFYELWCKRELL